MCFIRLLHKTSSYIFLNHLSYTKIYLYCRLCQIWISWLQWSKPLLVDSSPFDIIYGVRNFDSIKRIWLIHICLISFLWFFNTCITCQEREKVQRQTMVLRHLYRNAFRSREQKRTQLLFNMQLFYSLWWLWAFHVQDASVDSCFRWSAASIVTELREEILGILCYLYP